MWILRINKDKTLTELYRTEDEDDLRHEFERQVIFAKFRGLVPTDEEAVDTGYVEFNRDGKYECTLVMALSIAFSVIQE